jgi:hypothetical protein
MYPVLEYPWQQLVLDAFMELELLSLKIDRAERAISKRLRETETPALGAEERTALYDALRALRVMSPPKSEQQESSQTRNIV